jgi:hypothetical protein
MGFNYKKDTKKGNYVVQNPEKYLGNKPTIYKSAWERTVFHALDVNQHVQKWGYECIEIYYYHPRYMKWTVYYPDIYCQVLTESNQVQKLLVEIKPARFCTYPVQPKRPASRDAKALTKYQKALKRYEINKQEFVVNSAKWTAAQNWCSKHGVLWRILNEKNTKGLF